jgi:hypothetical protein
MKRPPKGTPRWASIKVGERCSINSSRSPRTFRFALPQGARGSASDSILKIQIVKRLIWLTCAASAVAAQDLAPPKDWNVEKQPGHFIFQPAHLTPTQNVQVQIYDAAPLPQDLVRWLTDEMQARGASASDLASCRPKIRRATEASCVTKSNGADQYWYAFKTADNHARFAHVVMAPNTLAGMRFIAPIDRLLKGAEANLGRAGGDAAPAIGEPPPAAQLAPAAQPAPAAVSNGSSYSVPMEGVYLHLEYLTGVGGGVYPSYEPYILLADGTITDDLSYYPSSDADVANWRRKKPRAWGRYVKNGSTLSIRWDDGRRKPETWDKWFVAKAGTESMRLSGLYQSIGGGGNTSLGGSIIVAAWSNYRFSPDGTVTSDRGSGGGSPNVAVLSQQAAKRAAYRISSYTIDLEYGDGRRVRSWFFRFPDSDDVIGMGDHVLTKRK